MTTLRSVIVDDEPLARKKIRSLLENEPDVQILSECQDGDEAVAAIREHTPDLVFLDVRMPGLDGFGVLDALQGEPLPEVIFVTAYDEYALGAFEIHAADYLLKPIRPDRFRAALDRVRQARGEGRSHEVQERLLNLLDTVQQSSAYPSRICVKTSRRILFLKVKDISWIDGAGNYARIHAGSEVHLMRHTLNGLEEKLDPSRFLRIHRSTIVNIDRIAEVKYSSGGELLLVLEGGQRLTVSRSYRERFQSLLDTSH